MRNILLICVVFSAVAGVVNADQVQDRQARRAKIRAEALKRFPQADTNRDGVLTDKEFLAHRAKLEQNRQRNDRRVSSPPPPLENIKYGPHQRNVLDFWQAKSDLKTPIVIYIHGGGFRAGDKSGVRRGEGASIIKRCLDNGVSFAAIHYRFRDTTTLPEILEDDIARAIQFIRHKSDDWNIDKSRLAAYGGSAGAGSSLWLGFHKDLADKKSKDPVKRESTLLTVIGALNTQATYDCQQWARIVGVPDSWIKKYGFNDDVEFYHLTRSQIDSEKGRQIRKELDMLGMMHKDGPAVYLRTLMPNTDPKDRGHIIHHPRHAIAVKKRCDELGLDAAIVLKETPQKEKVDMLDFFFKHLKVKSPKKG